MELATNVRQVWTGERVNLLEALVKQRIPYDEIGRRTGFSVGAVCGKVHRMGIGLGLEAQQVRKTSVCWAPPDTDHFAILSRQELEADDRTDATSLEKLEDGHCRFVLGEPAKLQYCGHKRKIGTSYCEHHLKRCTSDRDEASREKQSAVMIDNIRRGRRHGNLAQRSWGRTCAGMYGKVDTRFMEIASGGPAPA